MALKRIQDLDAAATLDGTELVELEQAGGSVQATAQDIANLAVGTGGDVTGPASSTNGNLAVFDGATGKLIKDGGPPASASDELTIVTEAGAFTAAPAAHSGRSKLILAGGNVTFDTAQSYVAGNVFNIRATAGLTLAVTGVTLTPPAGGTLALDADMSVTVAMTGATTGVVIGQTVAA